MTGSGLFRRRQSLGILSSPRRHVLRLPELRSCAVGVCRCRRSLRRAVSLLGLAAGSGIAETQQFWKGLRENLATCLAFPYPFPGICCWHCQRRDPGPDRLSASFSGLSCRCFRPPSALSSFVSSPQLVSAEGSHSDAGSVCADNQTELPPSMERTGGIGDSRPPSFQ